MTAPHFGIIEELLGTIVHGHYIGPIDVAQAKEQRVKLREWIAAAPTGRLDSRAPAEYFRHDPTPPPPPASAMGLCEKWRNDNGDYPDSKRDCADELEELLTPELAESLQYIRMNGVEFTTNCDIENMREFIARAIGIHRITGELP